MPTAPGIAAGGSGETPPASEALTHQALIYRSRDQLVSAAAAFLRGGLEVGDPVLIVASRPSLDVLSQTLGPDAGLVERHASDAWCPRPYERLQELHRLTADAPPGGVLRVLHEPAWDGSAASAREWAAFESVVNLALDEARLRLVCLYDALLVPGSVLGHAACTHPARIEDGAAVSSPEFVPTREYAPGPPPTAPDSAVELPLSWTELRAAVDRHARRLEVPAERIDDVVLAVQEIATNAELHGAPPVRCRLWGEGGELICQVSDAGPGVADPLTGWVPPDDAAAGGWGLPIARLTCDAVDIARRQGETLVTLFVKRAQGAEQPGR